MSFDFSAVPRHWFGGSRVASVAVDALNLLFPAGERFFVRSVRFYQSQIEDQELQKQVRGFMGQEARHGLEHERFFATLRAQGFQLDRFLGFFERLAFGIVEPATSPALRLATTAAFEHFTAHLARLALRDGLVDAMDPMLADLLRWHAIEELEHKAVAFDVLSAVDGRYSTRVAGMAMCCTLLATLWGVAFVDLMLQDLAMGRPSVAGNQSFPLRRRHLRFDRAVGVYLRRGFHPDGRDDADLLAQHLGALRNAA